MKKEQVYSKEEALVLMLTVNAKVTISGTRNFFYDNGVFYSIELSTSTLCVMNPNDLSVLANYRLA